MNIGIIGGGMMGLTLAQRLSSRGHRVTVYERDMQLGGLATYQDFGPFVWDRFYHVILPGDASLLRLLRDIGLADEMRWRRTLTGFYVDRTLHSVSSSWEFLRFKPVTLLGKMRLAFTILYCARIKDWRRLEQVPLESWLLRLSGKVTYEKIWKPLLLAKLGENYRRASAVFIWTYVKRLYSARDSAGRKEQLGHVRGGYKTVIDRLQELICHAGGRIHMGVTVARVTAREGAGVTIESDRGRAHFDKVICTSPTNVLQQIADPALIDVREGYGEVEYLGVICMVLITRRPLVPYYVVNIADERIPFTGIIGMSNVVSTEETASLHLTYLPKYVHSEDPLLRRPVEELRAMFMNGLRVMFPNLDESSVVDAHIHRAVKVQPLQVVNYSQIVPRVRTRHRDFFVLNTSQFVNNTLNNNEVVRAVDEFLEDQEADFVEPAPAERVPAAEEAQGSGVQYARR